MKKSILRQIIREEIQNLKEAKITTIPDLNTESNIVIAMLDVLKNDSKLLSAVEKNGMEYYDGESPKTVYTTLVNDLQKTKIVDDKVIKKVLNKLSGGDKIKFKEVITLNSESKYKPLFYKILAQGIIFELADNPNSNMFIKKSSKLKDAANDFSTNRGKAKFGNMMKNKLK